MTPVRRTACARAGLLGNPSDQYAGRAIALTLADFEAAVTIAPSDRFEIAHDETIAVDLREAVERLAREGCYGGVRLLQATLLRFSRVSAAFRALPAGDARLRFRISYQSTVPRQVGLSGSSAIVIAGLRALSAWFDDPLDPDVVAETALAAEIEELGIQAGPMDRVIQAHGGVLFMDFAEPRKPWVRLDPALLPPLFVAWDPEPGRESGAAHGEMRARWLRGEPEVREAMRVFPQLADEGLRCLEAGDFRGLIELLDRNFDTRAAIYTLAASDLDMVRIGREHGAGVKLCGSGGSVIGVLADESARSKLERAYAEAGYRVLKPQIA